MMRYGRLIHIRIVVRSLRRRGRRGVARRRSGPLVPARVAVVCGMRSVCGERSVRGERSVCGVRRVPGVRRVRSV